MIIHDSKIILKQHDESVAKTLRAATASHLSDFHGGRGAGDEAV
jgi:hypothetical protein